MYRRYLNKLVVGQFNQQMHMKNSHFPKDAKSHRPLYDQYNANDTDVNSSHHPHEPFTPNYENKRGNHIYSNLYPWDSKQELCDHLTKNIIHNNDGLLVLNKPFGIGQNNHDPNSKSKIPHHKLMHSRGFGSCDYSIKDILPLLRTTLNMPKLIPLKCAEKFTSGISIFANDEEKIKEKFSEAKRKGKCNKVLNSSFYIIVTNVPNLNQYATIEAEVAISHPKEAHGEAVITRDYSLRSVKNQVVKVVNSKLTVVSKNEKMNVALIKLEVSRTRSNFIRVYCLDLLMPILGDHLYGHRMKFILGEPVVLKPGHSVSGTKSSVVPQHILDTLEVRNDNAIEIPTHIHFHQYTLYNFLGKKRPLIVTAPLPQHFKTTLERFGLAEPLLM